VVDAVGRRDRTEGRGLYHKQRATQFPRYKVLPPRGEGGDVAYLDADDLVYYWDIGAAAWIVFSAGFAGHAKDKIADAANQHAEIKANVLEFGSLINQFDFKLAAPPLSFTDTLGTVMEFDVSAVRIFKDDQEVRDVILKSGAVPLPAGSSPTPTGDLKTTRIMGRRLQFDAGDIQITTAINDPNGSFIRLDLGTSIGHTPAPNIGMAFTFFNEPVTMTQIGSPEQSGRFLMVMGRMDTGGAAFVNRANFACDAPVGGATPPAMVFFSTAGDWFANRFDAFRISPVSSEPQIHFEPQSATRVVLEVQGTTGQTADLQQWKSDTSLLALIDDEGYMIVGGSGLHATAALQVDGGGTRGLYLPRMTTTQANSWLTTGAPSGNAVYDTTRDQLVISEIVNGARRALSQRRWFDVKDFGAVGDGSTDDAAAIQAAIDAVNAAGGGVAFFPEATYRTKSTLILKSGVRLQGEGYASTIRLNPDSAAAEVDCIRTAVDSLHWAIDSLHLEIGTIWSDGAGNPAGAMIRIRNSRVCSISNIWIDGVGEDDRCRWGIYVDDDYDDDDVADGGASHWIMYGPIPMIEGISSQADSAGIRIKAALFGWGHYFLGGGTVQTWRHTPTDVDTVYAPEGDKGLWIESVDGFRMVGYEIIDFDRCVVLGERTASSIAINVFGPAHIRFTDCAFETEGTVAQDGGALWADIASHVMVENTTLYGQSAASRWEVWLDDTIQNWFFSNCHIGIRADSAGGILLLNTTDYANYSVRFANCMFGEADVGIQVGDDADHIQVSNCYFIGPVDGIKVVGSHAVTLIVSNCDFNSPTAINWTNTGSRHLLQISNCVPARINTDGSGYGSVYMKDEFMSGTTEDGEAGSLGWSLTNGNADYTTIVADHPGILERGTGAVANTLAYTYTPPGLFTASRGFLPNEYFDSVWIALAVQTDTDTAMRIGHLSAGGGNPPADGLYFEKLFADTNWFAVSRAANVQTRYNTTIAVDTNWHRFEIRRSASGAIEFLIDGTVRATATATIPTVNIGHAWQIENDSAVDKLIRMDYFAFRLPIFGR
jgi:hypothetical protein